ncbi:hypothetical protein [Ferroplasma sp.]|uniref:hypothetical protein n=1 Tax=Ferroplasma sp. TaxID=2591003 RepID=UPI00307DEA95
MKGDLESDKGYLRDKNKVNGIFFTVFIALRFRILKILKDNNLNNKISVNEVIYELSKMEKIVESENIEYFTAIPTKVENLLNIFKELISMG